MAKSLEYSNKTLLSIALLFTAIGILGGYQLSKSKTIEKETIPANSVIIDQTKLFFTAGNQLYKEKKYADAIKKYHESLALNPNQEEVHISTSLASARLGQMDHALEHVQKALKINKKYSPAYVTLGKYYEMSEQYDKAKESYQAALAINPNLEQAAEFLLDLEKRIA